MVDPVVGFVACVVGSVIGSVIGMLIFTWWASSFVEDE